METVDNHHRQIEQLKSFARLHALPRTDVALFGVRCPYCGKSDRIKPLDPPETLRDVVDAESWSLYDHLWRRFALPGAPLGVCKFCENPLRLAGGPAADPLVT